MPDVDILRCEPIGTECRDFKGRLSKTGVAITNNRPPWNHKINQLILVRNAVYLAHSPN